MWNVCAAHIDLNDKYQDTRFFRNVRDFIILKSQHHCETAVPRNWQHTLATFGQEDTSGHKAMSLANTHVIKTGMVAPMGDLLPGQDVMNSTRHRCAGATAWKRINDASRFNPSDLSSSLISLKINFLLIRSGIL